MVNFLSSCKKERSYHLSRVLAVRIVEEVLIERGQRPTHWPDCPKCGERLHSKGFVGRQITSVIGIIRWKRRVDRCPHGCAIGQIAPLDNGSFSSDSRDLACAGVKLASIICCI